MDDTLFELTVSLIDELKEDPLYLALKDTHQALNKNSKIQALIKRFQETKSAYFEAKQYGKHHPDIDTRQTAYRTAKAELYLEPLVTAYHDAEKQFQAKLDSITERLAQAVSDHIPHTGRYRLLSKGGTNPCSKEKA